MTYKEQIIQSLEQLNGHGYLSDIYRVFEELYTDSLPKSWKANIRATLEDFSSDSNRYKGKQDLFYMVEGRGNGHWGLRNYNENLAVELTQEDDEYEEGKEYLKLHLKRERNVQLIAKAKKKFKETHGRVYCEFCGFDFEQEYGELGKDFIEAHHTKPISQLAEGEKTKIEDIVMLCSNCHSMVHRNAQNFLLLRNRMNRQQSN